MSSWLTLCYGRHGILLVDEAFRVKYDALSHLYSTTEQDVSALSKRYEAVQSRLEKIRAENEYLLGQLCEYAPSDFESDQSDLEHDDELLAKRFPLPRLDKSSSSASARRKSVTSVKSRSSSLAKKTGPTK